ncbi:MAG: MerR family transcriptional regulator [Propionibacteriales bacterium]|nr:MerR family transcriptional regulator [Propionibacteriales bacterium]
MADLLSIGAFSRMTFLTVKALRHYHDEGLLEPASVDPHSGYRYYRPEQVPTARLIRRLRDLDLPVDEVRGVLSAPDDATRNQVIVAHLDRMSRQLQETQETVESLRRLLSGGEELEVTERDEPALTTMAIRQSVSGDDALAWWLDAFAELHRAVRVGGLVRTGPDGALFPTKFFTEGVAELVVFVPVESAGTPTGRVEAFELPGTRLAVTTYDGPMIDLDGAYSAVGQAVLERATSADGPVRERYFPLGDEDDLLNHRTEVGWPVLA